MSELKEKLTEPKQWTKAKKVDIPLVQMRLQFRFGIAISILAKLSNCNCKSISIWNRRNYIIFHKLLCWSNRESKLQFQSCKWDCNFDFKQNCRIAIAKRFRFQIEENTSFFRSSCVGRIENRNCNSNRANGIAISISSKIVELQLQRDFDFK